MPAMNLSRNTTLLAFSILLFGTVTLSAASFVVPRDRDLVGRADAIVVGTAMESHAQFTTAGGIETLTTITVDEIIKGDVAATVTIAEPGGAVGNIAMIIPGSPQFAPGEKVLLFLKRTGAERWSTADLSVGKFAFHSETDMTILQRDVGSVSGRDADLRPYEEKP